MLAARLGGAAEVRLVAAGLDHRTAPLAVRERVAAHAGDAPTVLRWLVGHAGLRAGALLSTCNRTEFYVLCPTAAEAAEVRPRLTRYLDPRGELEQHLVLRQDAEAMRHLFRVAAGLESMVLGEAQILGQVRAAHATARDAGTLDARLDFVLRRALGVGKRVRTQTAIGRGAGSLGDVAVDTVREVVGGLRGRGVVLIGAGKIATLAGRRLRESHLRVVSRGLESAERLAADLGAEVVSLAELEAGADSIDAVVSSTNSRDIVIDAAMVARLQEARGHRSLCLVDLAVPRDIDPASGAIAGVTLVDVDGLGRRVEANLAGRRAEVGAAEALIEEELRRTVSVLDERDAAGPTIAALTRRAEQIRRREVARTVRTGSGADSIGHAQVEALTTSLVRKLLHAPIAHLRDSDGNPAVALWLREAFALDDPGEEPSRPDR